MVSKISWRPFLALAVTIIAAPTLSLAEGTIGGGGGGAVYCPAKKTWEATDLHEARVRHPELLAKQNQLRKTIKSPEQAAELVIRTREELIGKPMSPEDRQIAYRDMMAIYNSVRIGHPVDPRDSGEVKIAPGCNPEKRILVNHYQYDNKSQRTFAEELDLEADPDWKSLSLYDQFTLLSHDIFHGTQQGRVLTESMDPESPRQTSEMIRRLNGNLMSEVKVSGRRPLYENQPAWTCYAFQELGQTPRQKGVGFDSIYFDVVRLPDGHFRFIFAELFGYQTYVPTWIDLDPEIQAQIGTNTHELIINQPLSAPKPLLENLSLIDPDNKGGVYPSRVTMNLENLALDLSGKIVKESNRPAAVTTIYLDGVQVFKGFASCNRPK